MSPKQLQKAKDEFKPKLDWLDGILLLLVALAVGNIITALVVGRADAFRMVPCWVILLAICVTQRHLENQKIITILLGTLLCYGSHQLMYLNQAETAGSSEMIVSIGLVYVPIISFFVILVSTKVDNLQSKHDQLHARYVRLRTDANELVNQLHKMRHGDPDKAEDVTDDRAIEEKRRAFEYYREAFLGVMKIRYKRDIPNLIEAILSSHLMVEHGVVFECPDERSGDFRIRNIWGMPKGDATRDSVAAFRNGDLARFVADNKRPLFIDEVKRMPNLYENHDNFIKELFPLECVMPVVHLERCLFVVFIGKQKGNALLRFTPQLVEPLLTTTGQAIGKLMARDARPSFSTFTPGT